MSRVKVRPIPPHNPVYKDLPDLTKLYFQFPWQIVELDTYTANLITIGHLELLEEIIEAPSPGSTGAPVNATYLTLTNNSTLTDERVLTAGPGISLSDAGPNGTLTISSTGTAAATGDVYGPASAADNAVARFDTTTGKLIQSSGVSLDDANSLTGVKDLALTGDITVAGKVDGVDVSSLGGNFNALSTTVAGHTTELGVQDSRLDGHDTTLSSHTDTLATHTTELSTQDSRLDAHDSTLSAHTTELSVQDSRLDNHDTTLADHTETLADHSTDLFEHASTLNNHTDELSTHASRLDGHDTTLADHTETLADHSTDLSEHASTLNSHTDELADHTETLADHSTDLSEHASTLNSHTEELSTHDSRLDGHDTTLSDHASTLADHSTDLSEHASTLNSHTDTLANHATELSNQDSRLDGHDSRLAGHDTELSNQDSRLDAHDSTLSSHTATLSSHTTELGVQDSRLDAHDTTLSSHTSELNTLDSRVDAHDTTIASHTSTLTSHTNTLATHATDLSNHASTLATHTTELNTLDSRVDAHDTTIASHTSTLATHTTDLSNHASTLSSHTTSINNINTTVGDHTTTLNTLNTTVAGHTTTLSSHTTSISDLTAVPYITLSASNATSAERVLTKGGGIDISSTATTATIALDAATTAKLANLASDANSAYALAGHTHPHGNIAATGTVNQYHGAADNLNYGFLSPADWLKLSKLAADANAAYASAGHTHDTRYALLVHDHNTLYAPLDHTHPSTGVSFKDLNDNSVYSATEYDVGRGLRLSDGGEGGGPPQLRTNLTSGPGITISGLHELTIESNTVGAAYLTYGSINPYLTGARKLTQGTGITLVDGGVGGNLTINATATPGSGGFGNVVGPVSATDNAVVRFDAATGKLIKNSGVLIDASNQVSGISNLTLTGNITLSTAGATVDGIDLTALNTTVSGKADSGHTHSGMVTGSGASTVNQIPKISNTVTTAIVPSGISIDGSNNLSGVATLTASAATIGGTAFSTVVSNVSTNTSNITTLAGGNLAGKISGPASSVANQIPKFSDTTGKVAAASGVSIDGSNNITGVAGITATSATINGNLTVTGTVDGVDISARDAVLSSTTTTANNLVSVPYVTIGNSASTSAERALVAGNGITIYDGGANSNVTITNTHMSTIDPGPAPFPGEGYSERMWIPNWEDGYVHEVGLQMEVKFSNEWYWESRPCTADYPIGSTPRLVYTCPGNYNWWHGIQSKKFQVTRSANGANYGGFLFATRFAMGSSRYAQALFVGLLNYSLEPFTWNNMYSSFGVFRDGTSTYQNAYISSTDNNGSRVVHNTIPEISLYNGIDFYVMNPRFSNAFYWGWRDIGANTWNAYGPYASTLPRSGIDPMRVRFYTCAGNSGQWQFLDIGHTYVRG